jgi:hypothetical protein
VEGGEALKSSRQENQIHKQVYDPGGIRTFDPDSRGDRVSGSEIQRERERERERERDRQTDRQSGGGETMTREWANVFFFLIVIYFSATAMTPFQYGAY